MSPAEHAPHVMVIAGESSGDALGGALIKDLRALKSDIIISGIGGPAMTAQGLVSIFPMQDIALMGLREIVPRLVPIMRRINETATHICRQKPDILVLIDSPEFTHRVARRVKKQYPNLPIIAYVAPTVWAWRPARARQMARYFDYVLALLPFEPRVFAQLGGPPCAYVGHPLAQRIKPHADMDAVKQGQSFRKKFALADDDMLLAVLPGSRISEIKRLLPIFGETIRQIAPTLNKLRVAVPIVPHLAKRVQRGVQDWPLKTDLIDDEQDKINLFYAAKAALVASGTVTLELALANLPMIVAYKADIILEYVLRRIVQTPSVVLPNLILDRPAVPEYLMERCKPACLAPALHHLLTNTQNSHDTQCAHFAELRQIMQSDSNQPLQQAAEKVLEVAGF